MSDQYDTEGLSEYELKRLERIKKNEAYLASLGLADAPWKKPKKTKKKPKLSPKKRPLEDAELRKSKRVRRRSRHADNGEEEPLVMLSYREPDGESPRAVTQSPNQDDDDDDDESDTGRKRSTYRAPRRRIFRAPSSSTTLSEAEKKLLEKNEMDTNYLTKFREFLVYHNKISPQNERNVMRQVTKLATGKGVRYESPRYGWPEDCVFCKGTKITPLSDLVELYDEAVEAEDRWGRDHGNGWLLRHPIKKLLMYQQFCLKNPDFLAAKCRLTEYYDGQYEDDDDDDVDDDEEEGGNDDQNDNGKDDSEQEEGAKEKAPPSKEEEHQQDSKGTDASAPGSKEPSGETTEGASFQKIVSHRHAGRRLWFAVRYHHETEDGHRETEVSFEDLKEDQPLRLAEYIRDHVTDRRRRGSANTWASEILAKQHQDDQHPPQEWPVGTPIRKRFGTPGTTKQEWFAGRVESFDAATGWYMIHYEDGDREELDADGMRGVVVPQE